jgi:hypothetical protein
MRRLLTGSLAVLVMACAPIHAIAAECTVTETIHTPDGEPAKNLRIEFVALAPQTVDTLISSKPVIGKTDDSGVLRDANGAIGVTFTQGAIVRVQAPELGLRGNKILIPTSASAALHTLVASYMTPGTAPAVDDATDLVMGVDDVGLVTCDDSDTIAQCIVAINQAATPGSTEIQKAGVTVGSRATLNIIDGSNVTTTITDNPGSDRVDITIASAGGGGGGGLSDGDYGDITVGSSSTTLTVDADAITYGKIQNVSATDKLLGRSSAGAGDIQEISCGSACRSLLDDSDAATMRLTLGLDTAATQPSSAFEAPLTFSTGLTRATNTVTVNSTQLILRLSNLTSNGFVKAGLGNGTLSIDTSTYLTGNQPITFTGDATGSGTTSVALTIPADTVTNAKLADMNANTLKGNNTGGATNPTDLTATQATAMLNAMVGDSGSGGTKGLAPAPASGDATKCLLGNGTYGTCGPINPQVDISGSVTVTKEQSGATLYVHNSSAATLPADALAGAHYQVLLSVGAGATASLLVANDGFQSINWMLNGASQSGIELKWSGTANALYDIELFTEVSGGNTYRSWYVSPVNNASGKYVVSAATTANITLSGDQTIDGFATGAGDLILVKNQSTASQNGIYRASASTWTRDADADTSSEVKNGLMAWVKEGTANAGTLWALTTTGTITLASTSLTFSEVDHKAVLAGTGLTRTTNTISANSASTSAAGICELATSSETTSGLCVQASDTRLSDADKGDVTTSSTFGTWTIDNDVVTNAKSANMAVNTVKCRITSGTGDPEDCTAANVRTIISAVSGSASAYLDGTGAFSTPAGGGGLSDGDKGDITVGSSGTTLTIDNDVVTYAKMQNVSATDKVLGRSTAGSGDVEEIAMTAAGRALVDDADAAAQRTTLGLGTAATLTAGALDSWHFQAESLDDADTNWPTTANAVMVDSVSTASVQSRKFLGASATSAGGKFRMPTGSTTCKYEFIYQASAAPGTTNNKVRWRLDFRALGGTASMTTYTFADQSNANNTTMALFADTETHATTGLTAGSIYQFQLTRITSGVTNNMTQDAYLTEFDVTCY